MLLIFITLIKYRFINISFFEPQIRFVFIQYSMYLIFCVCMYACICLRVVKKKYSFFKKLIAWYHLPSWIIYIIKNELTTNDWLIQEKIFINILLLSSLIRIEKMNKEYIITGMVRFHIYTNEKNIYVIEKKL